MKKVSIIMPTFEGRKHIAESIQSAMQQTYPQVELIIVDDGSQDAGYRQWLKAQENDQIHIVLSQHQGPAAARNRGIAQASGDYILPLDDDDLIDSTYVEKAVKILDADEQIGVVYCKARRFGAAKGPWELPSFSVERMLVDNIVFISAVFRKRLWEQVGGFSSDMKNGLEDYDFWLSLLEIETRFYQIQETLFTYRIKASSRNAVLSRNKSAFKEIYSLLYTKHKQLYEKYSDGYLEALRQDWLEKQMVLAENQSSFSFKQCMEKILKKYL